MRNQDCVERNRIDVAFNIAKAGEIVHRGADKLAAKNFGPPVLYRRPLRTV